MRNQLLTARQTLQRWKQDFVPFFVSEIFRLSAVKLTLEHSPGPSKAYAELPFVEFPQQFLESRLAFCVAVRHQDDAIAGGRSGETSDLVDLLLSGPVGAQTLSLIHI